MRMITTFRPPITLPIRCRAFAIYSRWAMSVSCRRSLFVSPSRFQRAQGHAGSGTFRETRLDPRSDPTPSFERGHLSRGLGGQPGRVAFVDTALYFASLARRLRFVRALPNAILAPPSAHLTRARE